MAGRDFGFEKAWSMGHREKRKNILTANKRRLFLARVADGNTRISLLF
jgi:hypothetical protein